ncbi:hypothetical protein ACFLT1_10215, partial [Bacteroidota bacterium]
MGKIKTLSSGRSLGRQISPNAGIPVRSRYPASLANIGRIYPELSFVVDKISLFLDKFRLSR